jgi:hypothetical protein
MSGFGLMRRLSLCMVKTRVTEVCCMCSVVCVPNCNRLPSVGLLAQMPTHPIGQEPQVAMLLPLRTLNSGFPSEMITREIMSKSYAWSTTPVIQSAG